LQGYDGIRWDVGSVAVMLWTNWVAAAGDAPELQVHSMSVHAASQ
jgi:hypothetical protein